MAKKSYTATYAPAGEPGWWTVQIREVPGCITQGRSIAQARARIREALGLFLDVDEAVLDVRDELELAPAMRRAIDAYPRRRQAADREVEAASVAYREAVRLVLDAGLSTRDAGEVLGVSQARITQLAEVARLAELRDREGAADLAARDPARRDPTADPHVVQRERDQSALRDERDRQRRERRRVRPLVIEPSTVPRSARTENDCPAAIPEHTLPVALQLHAPTSSPLQLVASACAAQRALPRGVIAVKHVPPVPSPAGTNEHMSAVSPAQLAASGWAAHAAPSALTLPSTACARTMESST